MWIQNRGCVFTNNDRLCLSLYKLDCKSFRRKYALAKKGTLPNQTIHTSNICNVQKQVCK